MQFGIFKSIKNKNWEGNRKYRLQIAIQVNVYLKQIRVPKPKT